MSVALLDNPDQKINPEYCLLLQEVYDYQQQHAVASQDGRVSDLLGDQKEEALVYGPDTQEHLSR